MLTWETSSTLPAHCCLISLACAQLAKTVLTSAASASHFLLGTLECWSLRYTGLLIRQQAVASHTSAVIMTSEVTTEGMTHASRRIVRACVNQTSKWCPIISLRMIQSHRAPKFRAACM